MKLRPRPTDSATSVTTDVVTPLREWKQHSRRYPSIFDVMRERGITGVRSAVTTLPLSVVLDRRATYAKGVS
jgi:hypothetical protein